MGFPRIGEKRELKKATEKYWKGKISKDELLKVGRSLRRENFQKQKESGMDYLSVNDFSFYDSLLDLSVALNVIPKRFKNLYDNKLDLTFAMGRGDSQRDIPACAMKKWFNTNYHFIVPELDDFDPDPANSSNPDATDTEKIVLECQEAISQDLNVKPILIGPITFLRLARFYESENSSAKKMLLLDAILNHYNNILKAVSDLGIKWIQLEEPVFSLKLSEQEKVGLTKAYNFLKEKNPNLKILLATYFDRLGSNLDTFVSLNVDGLHLDAFSYPEELEAVSEKLLSQDSKKVLSAGIINGRNIWRSDIKESIKTLEPVCKKHEQFWVSSNCSLMFSPITLRNETKLDSSIFQWLAFAEEKLDEIELIKKRLSGEKGNEYLYQKTIESLESRRTSVMVENKGVRQKVSLVKDSDYSRQNPFEKRKAIQQKNTPLPIFPTTTIGSFPQTTDVRKERAKLKKGEITENEYQNFLQKKTVEAIKKQEEIGLDVLVHGEFERNDMVEYFADKLEGFAFTENGWVQSYGSRYVKPPIIYGDVQRKAPMTIEWAKYAAGATNKPVKGMLTGPITILQWSFVRDDIPRRETALQIALALRDEVSDLEQANIRFIQVDEPAIREGLPLKKEDWGTYLQWAIDSFRLATAVAKDETQIHTHMCYSDFNDIMEDIKKMDADVISIETSKSKMELLESFKTSAYPREIGPGIYDVHSDRIPKVAELEKLARDAIAVIGKEKMWINPDCGLKTRDWEEVTPSLKNLVLCAKKLREAMA